MTRFLLPALGCFCICVGSARAAFLIEVDTDGMDDGVLQLSPHFSFGGDTTMAFPSAPSPAFGMSGGDSIFGGDGAAFDTYVYTYSPLVDGSNLVIPPGTPLTGSQAASGVTAGSDGTYRVFATWPATQGVSGGLTHYSLTANGSEVLNTSIDQNGRDGDWVLIGTVDIEAAKTYVLTQQSSTATFISMRAAGVLFEPVPEPRACGLSLMGVAIVSSRRRRRMSRWGIL